ncbi:MAG: DUF58 domain-containing protein [Pseudoalteromonas prydzensis]|uniref:DUF58 domain-containing protein n=1 Tax=Pseudoalteromonas prydzensis TaxID=182141 RepID=UPI003F9443B8
MHENKKVPRPALFSKLKAQLFSLLLKNKHNTEQLTLTHNTIYILPSKLGSSFLLITALNFILAVNYQNNLILVMAYLMLVVMIFSLLLGYNNVKGLTVSYKKHIASYTPSCAQLQLQLSNDKTCHSLQFIYENKLLTTIDEVTAPSQLVSLDLPLKKRGEYPLKRLKIISRYPFGLVSTWSYMQLTHSVFVYPQQLKPVQQANQHFNQSMNDGEHKNTHGSDEFDGLIPHQVGMNMKRVSWKHYAKTQQLMVKEFVTYSAQSVFFDFNQLQGNTESRLQQLSYLISNACQQGTPYGLQLEAQLFDVDEGKQHCKKCLEALSRYSNMAKD